jgi:hypothetical protein
MKKGILIILAAALFMTPGIVAAQMQGGMDGGQMMGDQRMMSGQHMMGPGMMNNMELMSGMMSDMHQMMSRGHMTSKQQGQMLGMIHQMGGIMQEMGMPKKGQLAGQHNKQLQEMRKQLDQMKMHMK